MIVPLVIFIGINIAWELFKWVYTPRPPLDKLHGPPSPSWFTGHLLQLYDKQSWDFHRDLHMKYGPVSLLQGMFGKPMLCVYDPLAMHYIVLKEQHIFEEMEWFLNFAYDSLGPGIVATIGETHRKQRKLLNPVFSTKNLRRLTPVFYEVVNRLKDAIKAKVDAGAPDVDMAQYMGRAALELVGKATLGHSFDPLTEERHDPYAEAVKSFVPAMSDLSQYLQLYRILRPLVPGFLRRPLMDLLPSRRVKRFLNVIYPDDDKKAKDLITILLRANAGASEEDMLPEEELVSQLSILVFVATDTSSNALTLILERLAENPHVQDRLRAEILAAKGQSEGGQIPFDELMSLPYLEAVVRETLRVTAPAPLRLREARADTVLPLSKPIQGKDGSMLESIPVPKGTLVFVAVQASNVCEDLWGPDAREWRPERWLEPLPETVTEAKIPGIYSHLMTFWGGGRSCIGFKFSQLEIKTVLAELLSTFKFEKTDVSVVWNMAEVIHPTVGTDSLRPAYPMKVTLIDSSV
ncbi:cytochrome P450 [Trametes coccinea BRFM310]|uniref:Cytochrome P450 n=1 Tax=Trametes coccinea (strain BRFM310) TaxID=1353009 RepID=A0A1Y2IGX2_TRAC3|nr:cytochrome P450 [Trametes coccinea BRFM310]